MSCMYCIYCIYCGHTVFKCNCIERDNDKTTVKALKSNCKIAIKQKNPWQVITYMLRQTQLLYLTSSYRKNNILYMSVEFIQNWINQCGKQRLA